MSEELTQYSEEAFWDKLRRFAKTAGREVVQRALELYYTLDNPATPAWAKTVIYGSLAYFIWPADAIPDFIAAVGYSDDLGALAAALVTVAAYTTPEIKQRAKEKLAEWFA